MPLNLKDDLGILSQPTSVPKLTDDIGIRSRLKDDVGIFDTKPSGNVFTDAFTSIWRGGEKSLAGVGSGIKLGGEELKYQASKYSPNDPKSDATKLTPIKQFAYATGSYISDIGNTMKGFYNKAAEKGVEAPNPAIMLGWKHPFRKSVSLASENLPMLLTAGAVTAVTKSPLAGASIFAPQTAGDFYEEATKNGMPHDKARDMALLDAMAQTGLENIALGQWMKGGTLLKRMARTAIAEGPVEEGSQQVFENTLKVVGWKGKNDLWNDLTDGLAESVVAGALSGAVLGGFEAPSLNDYKADFAKQVAKEGKEEGHTEEQVQTVIKTGHQMMDKLADNLQNKKITPADINTMARDSQGNPIEIKAEEEVKPDTKPSETAPETPSIGKTIGYDAKDGLPIIDRQGVAEAPIVQPDQDLKGETPPTAKGGEITFGKPDNDGLMDAISVKVNGEEAGTIHLKRRQGEADLHIVIKPELQGKGLGAEVIESAVNKFSDKYGKIVIARGRIVNDNLIKVIEKVKARGNVGVDYNKEFDRWEFSKLSPKETQGKATTEQVTVEEKATANTDEATALKIAKKQHPIDTIDREGLVNDSSGKYISDGRYLIIDKKIAEDARDAYWVKKAKKLQQLKGMNKDELLKLAKNPDSIIGVDRAKNNNTTPPPDYERVIPKLPGEQGRKSLLAEFSKVHMSGSNTYLVYQNKEGTTAGFDVDYVKMIKDYFPNSKLYITSADKPAMFVQDGEIKAVLMPVDIKESVSIEQKIKTAIEDKDVKYLHSVMNGINPNANKIFTQITGLPSKLQRESNESIRSLDPVRYDELFAPKPIIETPKMSKADAIAKAQKARADKALLANVKFRGEIMTKKQMVEKLFQEGATSKISQENVIKEMSRTQYNRADGKQQAEHEKRIKEAGTKNVYYITDTQGASNTFFEVSKTEHDYFNSLKQSAEIIAPAPADLKGESLSTESKEAVKAEEPIIENESENEANDEAKDIADFGIKIGGARKDLAVKTGTPGGNRVVPTGPAWARSIRVLQSIKTGKWQICKKGKDWAGRDSMNALSRQEFDTEKEAEKNIPLAVVAQNHRVYGKKIANTTAPEQSSRQADEWLNGITRDIEALKKGNEELLMKKGLTDRYKKEIPDGSLDGFEKMDKLIKEKTAKGELLNDEQYAKATEILNEIDKIKQRKMSGVEEAQVFAIHRILSNRNTPIVKGGFASRDEAMAYMATHAVEIIEHKFPFPEKPWLDHIERIGKDHRNGKNVTTKAFQDTFGFRGGEFGNWNMGSDGQAALNYAYDALLDLAETLDIKPESLSLHGELSIAFGARGQGLVNARAHFEPDHFVINLTKIKGAGSLAHEWLHAVNYYLAMLDGKMTSTRSASGTFDKTGTVTEGFSWNSKLDAKVIESYKSLIKTITAKEVEKQIAVDQAQKRSDYISGGLKDTLDSVNRSFNYDYTRYNKRAKIATAKDIAKWEELKTKLLNGEYGEKVFVKGSPHNKFGGFDSYQIIRDMNDLFKSITGHSFDTANSDCFGRQLYLQIKSLADSKARVEQAKSGATEKKVIATDYLKNAKDIDSYRSSDYWSIPEEMTARAFESYIYDKLNSGKKRSDYLVYGVENKYYASLNMKPYPEGEERTLFNQSFDALFKAIVDKTGKVGYILREGEINLAFGGINEYNKSIQKVQADLQNVHAKNIRSGVSSILSGSEPKENNPGEIPQMGEGGKDKKSYSDTAPLLKKLSEVARRLQERGFVDFKGYNASSAQDIAEIAVAFRHPLVENLQVVYIKGEEVVSHQVISSGKSNEVAFTAEYQKHIKEELARLNADSFYIVHNHPSGDPTPSPEDFGSAIALREQFENSYKGDIVLNHKKYSVISVGKPRFLIGPQAFVKEHSFSKEQENYREGFYKMPTETVEQYVATLTNDFLRSGKSAVIFIDGAWNIMGVEYVGNQKNIAQNIKEHKKHYSAGHYIIVFKNNEFPNIKQYPEGLVDIVNIHDGGGYLSFKLGDKSLLHGATLEKRSDIANHYRLQAPQPNSAQQFLGVDIGKNIKEINDTWTSIREYIEDDWLRVKKLIQNDKANVTQTNNMYEAEIRYWGRLGTRMEEADHAVVGIDKDIVATAKKLSISDKLLSSEISKFLIARHTPERNAEHGEGASGMTNAEAQTAIDDIRSNFYSSEVERIANSIQDINHKVLDTLLEGEVITQELHDSLRSKYPNHIPLQRVMPDEDIVDSLTSRGYGVKGAGLKRAKGSKLEVADILTNVTANYKSAIARSEKNILDNYTLRFARDNEYFDGLFEEFKAKAVGKTFDGRIILETINDPMVLPVMDKGKQVYLKINDAQLAMALRGVNRAKVDGLLKFVKTYTRFYSGLMTRFNPEFVLPNKIRDLQEMIVYLASKDEIGLKGALKSVSNDPQSIKDITDFIRGKDTPGTRLYKQMKMDGGTTGGMGLSTRDQLELNLEEIRRVNRSAPRAVAKKIISSIDAWNTLFEDSTRLSAYKQALSQGVSREKAAVLAKEASINFNKMGKGSPITNAVWMFSNASIQGSAKMLRAMKNPKVLAAILAILGGAIFLVNEYNDKQDKDWRKKVRKWDKLNGLNVVIKTNEGIRYVTIPISWGLKPIKVILDSVYDMASGHSSGVGSAMGDITASVIEGYNPVGGTDAISALMPTILDLPVDIARNKSWNGGKIRPNWNNADPDSIKYFDSLRQKLSGKVFIAITKNMGDMGIEVSPADMNYAYESLIGGAGKFINKIVDTASGISQGKVEAKSIPFLSRFYRDIPEEEIRETDQSFDILKTTLQKQAKDKFYFSQEAELVHDSLKTMPKAQAYKRFNEIMNTNPRLAEKIVDIKKDEDLNINYKERMIKQLGVENGERAKYIFQQVESMKDPKAKYQYVQNLMDKKIISEKVMYHISILKNMANSDRR